MNESDDSGALAGIVAAPLAVLVAAWLISAITAAMIAEHRGRSVPGFFFVTLFFLGPLGPGVALIADREHKGVPVGPADIGRPVASGRRRFTCPRCGAGNDIPLTDTAYNCWRCAEHRAVLPAG